MQLHRAPRSYDWYQERCQSFLDTIPATLTVGQLRPFHVQAWVDGKRWSDGMKRGAMTAVQRVFNRAVKLGHIDSSPIAHMEKPPQGRREKIIIPQMYEKILGLVRDHPFKDLLAMAWETRARPKELGRATSFSYDARNRIVATLFADGSTSLTDYDGNTRIARSIDPNGNVASFTYDAMGRLLTTIDPLAGQTTRTYDAVGNMRTFTDQLGRTTTYTYDRFDRLTQTQDPLSHTTTYTYDVLDRQTAIIDAYNRTTKAVCTFM